MEHLFNHWVSHLARTNLKKRTLSLAETEEMKHRGFLTDTLRKYVHEEELICRET